QRLQLLIEVDAVHIRPAAARAGEGEYPVVLADAHARIALRMAADVHRVPLAAPARAVGTGGPDVGVEVGIIRREEQVLVVVGPDVAQPAAPAVEDAVGVP